jgi:ABC-type anion transport system duplicated permease subunit
MHHLPQTLTQPTNNQQPITSRVGHVVVAVEATLNLILVTTLQQNGRNFPTKNAIRFARSATRKESKEVRSVTYPNSRSTKQLTTALISSLHKVLSASDASSENTAETPKQSNQTGNTFGGRERAKRQKNSE